MAEINFEYMKLNISSSPAPIYPPPPYLASFGRRVYDRADVEKKREMFFEQMWSLKDRICYLVGGAFKDWELNSKVQEKGGRTNS